MRGELLAVQILVCNSGSEKSVRVYWQQQCVWQGLVYQCVCTGSSNLFSKVWYTGTLKLLCRSAGTLKLICQSAGTLTLLCRSACTLKLLCWSAGTLKLLCRFAGTLK